MFPCPGCDIGGCGVPALCGRVCLCAISPGSCARRVCDPPPLFEQFIHGPGWDPFWAFGINSRNGFDTLCTRPHGLHFTSQCRELDYLLVVFAPDFFSHRSVTVCLHSLLCYILWWYFLVKYIYHTPSLFAFLVGTIFTCYLVPSYMVLYMYFCTCATMDLGTCIHIFSALYPPSILSLWSIWILPQLPGKDVLDNLFPKCCYV